MTDFEDLYKEYRFIALPRASQLTPAMLEQLDDFLGTASPSELREELMELYHSYILHEHGALPIHFERMAMHMNVLFDYLRSLAEATSKEEGSKKSRVD